MSKEKSTYEIITDLSYYLSQHSGNSLIEYTSPARAQPITLLDTRAAQLPYIEAVMHSAVNIFSGYYLQAYSLSLNVGSVDVLRTLDKLNPNRDPLLSLKGGRLGGIKLESADVALPFYDKTPVYSQESALEVAGSEEPMSSQVDRDFLKQHNENANLSVGKLLKVSVESNGSKAEFPVMVQLLVSNVSPALMTHTLSLGNNKDRSLTSRWREYRAGMISFWRDLVFCQDLIDGHKKALMEDAQGHYRTMNRNNSKNVLTALLSGTPSVATASSIYIMTSQTASELETKIRGRLNNFKEREDLFKQTFGMLIFVIDTEWDRVTIYHRSIEKPTTISIKEIQRKNKQSGPDILDVLNAYNKRENPVI